MPPDLSIFFPIEGTKDDVRGPAPVTVGVPEHEYLMA